MTTYLVSLLHPLGGLVVLGLAVTAAIFGWRYRNARLGKSGHDVMGTFALMQQHQTVGIALLILTVTVWVGGIGITRILSIEGMIYGYPHEVFSLALVTVIGTSATVMLLFRQRTWASPVHLTLNGFAILLLAVQLLSGVGIMKQLFYF